MRRSKLISLSSAVSLVKKLVSAISKNRLASYASEASFFIVVSSLPFAVLLISIGSRLIPIALPDIMSTVETWLPASVVTILEYIIADLRLESTLPIASIALITTLLSASRGVRAVTACIEAIYSVDSRRGYIERTLRSLVYTVLLVLLILATLIVLVFGESIRNVIALRFSFISTIIDAALTIRGLLFCVILTLFFAMIYRTFSYSKASKIRKFSHHLPGAAFASAGWMLFSLGYSQYLKYFPNDSYIYGTLAVIILMLLWLYFCMIILLLGAELNVLLNTDEP